MLCGFCQLPGNHPVLGPLLGPIGGTEYYVHRPCALWSPEVHESEEGTLLRVLEAVRRGRQLRCSGCGRRGASLGCRVAKCRETFHALCAHQAGCTMFLNHNIACKSHARRYLRDPVHPAPFGAPLAAVGVGAPIAATPGRHRQALDDDGTGMGVEENPWPGETPAAAAALASPLGVERGDGAPSPKRRRIEEALVRRERAADVMKRVRAQQRRAAAAAAVTGEGASDDEEHFARREAARLERDIAKLNPITLGAHRGANGSGPVATQSVFLKAPKTAPKTAAPRFQPAKITAAAAALAKADFSDLAGAESVVRQLRESVLLPLLYPEVFARLHATPPRGILFHGPPGTGKTLAARALAGACARAAPTPVTFFSRKGCDCLGKFVGDAERTLRLMFEEASRRAPSIIFIDEIEALVPARRGGTGGASAGGGDAQDQIHASVVSTLLALMDGMADRGNVVVLAATNRPDSVDAALRRPGRFDREVYFSLPAVGQREAILRAHTRNWAPAPPAPALLARLAAATEGYAGADLAALCAAAVTAAARRAAPMLVERAEAAARGYGGSDGSAPAPPPLPEIEVEEQDWAASLTAAPPPCSKRDASHALATDCARSLAHHAAPLLLPPLRQALAALGRTEAPLPEAVARAIAAAVAAEVATSAEAAAGDDGRERPDAGRDSDALEAALVTLGAVQPGPGGVKNPNTSIVSDSVELPAVCEPSEPSAVSAVPRPAPGASYPALRLLLAGTGESGQSEVAGAVLRLFGGSHVAVLSLPAMAAEGAGDVATGAVALAREALARASPRSALVLYLPRLEAWAAAPEEEEEEEDGAAKALRASARVTGLFAGVDALGQVPASPPPFGGIPAMAVRSAVARATAYHRQAQRRGAPAPPPPESDAWAALDSMLREAAPRQPLVVIATSGVPAAQLPPVVLEGFERSCGVVTVDLDAQKGAKAEEVLEQALARAGEVARAAVASAGAAAFSNWAVPPPVLSEGDNTAAARVNTPAAAEGLPPASPQPPAAPLAAVAERAKARAGLNAAEWERAQALFTAVQGFLAETGARLASDRRCGAAGAVALPLPPRPEDPVLEVSVRDVALDAVRGRFLSLEAFQGALARAVAAIDAAAKEEKRSGDELTWHISAAAVAHAIEDEVAVAIHAFRAGLELDDVGNARVLAAATTVAAEVTAAAQEASDKVTAEEEDAERLVAAAGEGDKEGEEGGDGGGGAGAEAAQGEFPAANDAYLPHSMDLEGLEAVREAATPIPAPPLPAVDAAADEAAAAAAADLAAAAELATAAELAARRSSAFSQAHSLILKSGGWKEAAVDFAFSATLRGCPLWPAAAETVPALVAKGAEACHASLAAMDKDAGIAGGAHDGAALGRLASAFVVGVARDLAKGLRS